MIPLADEALDRSFRLIPQPTIDSGTLADPIVGKSIPASEMSVLYA